MTERINHAQEARFHMRTAVAMANEGDKEGAQVALQLAQIDALLAQVEQQRIANLIAWTTGSGYEPGEVVAAEIREALGLA